MSDQIPSLKDARAAMIREAHNRRKRQEEKTAMALDKPDALDELERDERPKRRGRPPKSESARPVDVAPKKRGRKPGVKYPRKTDTPPPAERGSSLLSPDSGKYEEWKAILDAEHEKKLAALKTLFGIE